MTAPFEDRDGWEMTALALDGSVYIEQHDPPEIRSKRYVIPYLDHDPTEQSSCMRIQAEGSEFMGMAIIYGLCIRVIFNNTC
jgi:hypothetical protein